MKTQSVDNKSRNKNSTALNFYSFKNNDFLKTNVLLNQPIHLKTSPDDVQFDQETYLKLIKNNQGISGSLNARKVANKEPAPKPGRNASTPALLPLDLMKINKTSAQSLDVSPDVVPFSMKNALSNKISFASSRHLNTSNPGSGLLSQSGQAASARISTAKSITDPFTLVSPRGHLSKKSLFGMTPEEVHSLEKQIIAKTKLERDRNETLSRVSTRNDAKRDVSYYSERGVKAYYSPNSVQSPGTGSMQHINTPGTQETQGMTLRGTPEYAGAAILTTEKTNSSGVKKNTDFTSIEEEQQSDSKNDFQHKMRKASFHRKKPSIDYSISPQNANPPQLTPLSLHKGHIASLTGLPSGASLTDFLLKGLASPAHHYQGRSPKPSTAGPFEGKLMPRMFDSPRRKLLRVDTSDAKKMETEDMLSELKKEIPNILSGAPASRQDVIVLSNWMNTKIQQIDASVKEEEKSRYYDRLYNVCINEVLRQISVECSERGDLLYRIWSCYFQIFAQCKLDLEGEIQKIKAEHQKESQKQYEWHQSLLDKKNQDLEDCKLEIQKLVTSQDEDQLKLMKLLNRNTKYKQRIDQLKTVISVNKAQIEEVKDENRRYAKRLAYKIATNTKGTYVPTFIAHNQGGPKENLRESSVPENLGVGSSIASPRKLNLPLTPVGLESHTIIPSFKVATEEDRNSEDSETDESSMDFVYEDTLTNSKQVFKIEHLNNNVLMHKKNNVSPSNMISEQPEMTEVRKVRTCTRETQTQLVLAEEKYDGILHNQKLVDDLVTELKVKKEIDILADADDITSLDLSKIPVDPDLRDSKAMKRTGSWQTMQTRSMLEDRMDGLVTKTAGTLSTEFLKSLKKKLFPGSEPGTPVSAATGFHGTIRTLDGDTPKGVFKRSLNDMPYRIVGDEVGSSGDTKPLKSATSPKNTNYLFVFEPIQEQLETNEDGKSFTRSQSRINRESDEQGDIEGSVQPDDGERENDEEQNEQEIPLGELEEGEEEEEEIKNQLQESKFAPFGSPVPKLRDPVAFTESYQNTPKNISSISDDLFHNLNEVAAEFGDVVDRGNRYASQIGSIAEDEEHKDDNENSLDENLQSETQKKQGFALNRHFGSFETAEEPRRAYSLSTLVNTKTHAMHMVSMLHAKREDLAITDKAKLFTVLRMYKVEKEKNKILQSGLTELEEQIMNEKENQGKMKDNMDEMKVHIKMLEKLKAKCPHGKCKLCKGEEDSEFEEIESTTRNDLASSNGNRTTIMNDGEERMLLEEVEERENEGDENAGGEEEEDGDDGDGDEDGDEGEEGGDTVGELGADGVTRKMTRQSTGKGLKKKKLTSAQQPVFAQKKAVNQNQIVSAAIAIINKVKDKKLTKFRNFMPIKSVLKNIHVLYTERINQAKDNAIIKDDEFFVFAYKWFHNNFGFRKIAEQKYIIFLLSVKKYLHVVRINLFARFMSLLQGSSNFSADEFGKYLEGLEILNNSTLGIPIVNSETDSKFYVPFLRGLEYLRYFSENKLSTDEYIEFKREFDALKDPDPKNINRNGILDIDVFMTKVLTKYRIICNRTKQFVVNAFKAADLDANKYCSLKEFIIIYRNIDPDRFDHGFAENLFNEHADIKVQGEINLSFDKFTVVCVEYGLFTDLQQDQFLGIQSPQEMDEKIQDLKNNWHMHHFEIERKLKGSVAVTADEKAYWFSILNVLNERMTDFDKLDPNDYKPNLIAFKILEQEVEKLLDNEAERDAYGLKIVKSDIKSPL